MTPIDSTIHDVRSSPRDWTANIPKKISALQGSCVVIPCTYRYPDPIPMKILSRWKGFWITGTRIVSTSDRKWLLAREYRQRTQLLGDLRSLNCTMRIDGVRLSDTGPFYFRIAMPEYKSFSYKDHRVSIDVMRSLPAPSLFLCGELKLDAVVSASCSVSYSCPSFRPRFFWSRSGTTQVHSKKLNNWKWETTSTLKFRLLATDHNKLLNCSVMYRAGQRVKSSTVIQLIETPLNATAGPEPTVKEGDFVGPQ
ncbi:myeloid cell surface antigen CD33-like [Centroberyx gerrardi]